MNFKKIENLLKMKQIQRLPNVPHHRGYNILEHGFVVGMLFRWFASQEDVAYDINIWDKVLMHDYAESFTGDLNYCVKNFNETTAKAWGVIENEVCSGDATLKPYSDEAIKACMNDRQYRLFKICDYLDLWIFCMQEKALGNTTKSNEDVIDNCWKLIRHFAGTEFMSVFTFMGQFKA